jgi:hypothetical protein
VPARDNWETPDQRGFLGATPALQLVLASSRGGERVARLCPGPFHGAALGGPVGSSPSVMVGQATRRVVAHASVVRTVGALHDVAEKYGEVWRQGKRVKKFAKRCICPSRSSGQILRSEIWRRGESNPRPKSPAVGRLHAYLIRYRFRQRPSGTSNNEPPASLLAPPKRNSRPTASDGGRRASPLDDASFRPAGRTEEARYLIRQRKQTACWQLCVPRRLRVVWTPGMPSKHQRFRRNRNAPVLTSRLRCGKARVKPRSRPRPAPSRDS